MVVESKQQRPVEFEKVTEDIESSHTSTLGHEEHPGSLQPTGPFIQ